MSYLTLLLDILYEFSKKKKNAPNKLPPQIRYPVTFVFALDQFLKKKSENCVNGQNCIFHQKIRKFDFQLKLFFIYIYVQLCSAMRCFRGHKLNFHGGS